MIADKKVQNILGDYFLPHSVCAKIVLKTERRRRRNNENLSIFFLDIRLVL